MSPQFRTVPTTVLSTTTNANRPRRQPATHGPASGYLSDPHTIANALYNAGRAVITFRTTS